MIIHSKYIILLCFLPRLICITPLYPAQGPAPWFSCLNFGKILIHILQNIPSPFLFLKGGCLCSPRQYLSSPAHCNPFSETLKLIYFSFSAGSLPGTSIFCNLYRSFILSIIHSHDYPFETEPLSDLCLSPCIVYRLFLSLPTFHLHLWFVESVHSLREWEINEPCHELIVLYLTTRQQKRQESYINCPRTHWYAPFTYLKGKKKSIVCSVFQIN